jgi:hypothetical protein
MKPSFRRMMPFAAAVCGLVLIIWAYVFHARREWALVDYKHQLHSAGERLSVDELLPRPLAAESNGARFFIQAQRQIVAVATLLDTNPPEAMWMVAPGKAMVAWKQSDVRGDSTNTWEQVEAELARERDALDLLEQIIQLPAFDFHLDYHQGYTLLLPYLAIVKKSAQRLKTAALCELRWGETARAATRVRAILALSKGLADERLVISQLVRLSIAHIALTANWELMQSFAVTEEQLADLQNAWMSEDYLPGAENALLMDRAMGEQTADEIRESSANYRRVMGFGSSPSGGSGDWLGNLGRTATDKGKETMWRYAWSYPDQLKGLQGKQGLLDALRRLKAGDSYKAALALQTRKLAELGIEQRTKDDDGVLFGGGEDPRYVFTDSVLALERFPRRLMNAETARQLVITTIALKRCQLKRGNHPQNLAALVPEFLPAIPRDPVDGQSLRYKLNPDGTFLLYSIGEDGVDNGGDPATPASTKTFPWLKGRDMVWPVPATDAEVFARREKIHGQR